MFLRIGWVRDSNVSASTKGRKREPPVPSVEHVIWSGTGTSGAILIRAHADEWI
jgi:hypothetical protein